MDRIAAAADYLFDMRVKQRQVAALPDDVVPRSLAEGYQVQELLVRKLLARGNGHPIGYKIACTNVLAQQALGVDAPFFGVLMSHSTHRSGVTLPATDFVVRCAEVEFGFAMAQDVPPGTTYTAETIKPFVGSVIPSIEMVDHRYHSWKTVGAPSLLADNAIHGCWVEGEPVTNWQGIDFTSHPTALIVNGEQTFPGSGAAVLGNPLNVVAWLANELPKFGRRLSRGDKITTGLTTDVYLANPGDHLSADFGPLGRVEMTFA
ncbi:MAG: hydratase [Planctomycetaceae bacterium]|nr:hydratase [Planctomycetaceae bacterium]